MGVMAVYDVFQVRDVDISNIHRCRSTGEKIVDTRWKFIAYYTGDECHPVFVHQWQVQLVSSFLPT